MDFFIWSAATVGDTKTAASARHKTVSIVIICALLRFCYG